MEDSLKELCSFQSCYSFENEEGFVTFPIASPVNHFGRGDPNAIALGFP